MASLGPDAINAALEAVGGAVILSNCYITYKDKSVAGVRWWTVVFFTTWGIWNLFYYPHLGQTLSFYAGVFMVVANILWVTLLIYFRGRKTQ